LADNVSQGGAGVTSSERLLWGAGQRIFFRTTAVQQPARAIEAHESNGGEPPWEAIFDQNLSPSRSRTF